MHPRVLVIGLDCAPPALVFDRFRDTMPFVSGLMDRGIWGPLRSTVPPITVPAWTTMTTGRDPGELGLYGFRNRVPGSYALQTASSADVDVPRVWDVLGEAGKRVSVCFVPPAWPPRPVRGEMVSCFMAAPDTDWTHPRSLARELEARFGPYRADVAEPRRGDHARVIAEIREATTQHFAIVRHLWRTRRPDFLMMVEMGPDRLHHALWRRMQPGGEHELAARGYYTELDGHVADLAAAAGEDTTVILASDHGARDMTGGVRINEWMIERGWLVLRAGAPDAPGPLRPEQVDWSRTRAWGEGGYHARIMLNVAGREPEGIIARPALEAERARLGAELGAMRGPDGGLLGNVVLRPEDAYRTVRGLPPDLIVALGDLAWRSLGTVGTGEVFTARDDASDDGCNHDWNGIFVAAGPGLAARGRAEGMSIEDVAPTILARFGVPRPGGMHGRDLAEVTT